jgi:hypothetical protein
MNLTVCCSVGGFPSYMISGNGDVIGNMSNYGNRNGKSNVDVIVDGNGDLICKLSGYGSVNGT